MTTYTNKLRAGTQFPRVTATLLNGETVELGKPRADNVSNAQPAWQMVVVYRGQHCPICSSYLTGLKELVSTLAETSIDVIAVSADSKEQLETQLNRKDAHHIDTPNFPIAYGLSIEAMQQLGVYISNPRNEQETNHPFAEPALFVINDKNEVQIVDYSNVPFARPDLSSVVGGLQWIRNPENDYPIRGTYQ